MQIHKQLPAGGILVFMTGQREVEQLCMRLRSSSEKQEPNNHKASKLKPPRKATDQKSGTDAETELQDEEELDIADASGHDKAELDANALGLPFNS